MICTTGIHPQNTQRTSHCELFTEHDAEDIHPISAYEQNTWISVTVCTSHKLVNKVEEGYKSTVYETRETEWIFHSWIHSKKGLSQNVILHKSFFLGNPWKCEMPKLPGAAL